MAAVAELGSFGSMGSHMKRCSYCGRENDDAAVRCVECGTDYPIEREQEQTSPLALRDWMLTLLVLAIPFVNVIMYVVWAFNRSGNVNRRNFCMASLIWILIILVIGLIVGVFSAVLK